MKNIAFVFALLASTAALACPVDRICVGNRIIDGSDDVGSVVEVFSNGQAKVSLDAYSGYYFRSVKNLGKGIDCLDGICMKDRAMDGSEHVGTVVEVFSNGKAKLSLDAYSGYYVRRVANLGKGFRCIEDVCVDTRIIDSSNNVGTIVELFDNGKAKVSLDAYSGYYVRSLEEMGIELKCELRKDCACKN